MELVEIMYDNLTQIWDNHLILVIENLGDDMWSIYTDYIWYAHWFLNDLSVFSFLVHRLLLTFMALCLDFASTIIHFSAFYLTYNMLVKRHIDFLALGFLTGVDVIGKLGLLSMTPSRVDNISA